MRRSSGFVSLSRRGGVWWANWRVRGERFRMSMGTTHLADARIKAGKIEEGLRRRSIGLVDAATEHAILPIGEHLDAFQATMEGRGGTARHVVQVLRYLRAGFAFCGVERIGDLDGASISRWIEEGAKAAPPLSPRTLNARLAAVRAFSRWSFQTRRAPHDALAGLKPRNQKVDRRRVRRALAYDEVTRLLSATAARPLAEKKGKITDKTRAKLTALGAHRALVYLVAQGTGLRRGELTRVRWDDLDLGAGAQVSIPAASAKSRVDQSVPLSSGVLAALVAARAARSGEAGTELVFPPAEMPNARTFSLDLLAAGLARREEAEKVPEGEKAKPGKIRTDDARGRIVDFHALRTSFVSGLVVAGINPKVAQLLARHSTIELTMGAYTDPALLDTRGAIEKASRGADCAQSVTKEVGTGRSESPTVETAAPASESAQPAPDAANRHLRAVS